MLGHTHLAAGAGSPPADKQEPGYPKYTTGSVPPSPCSDLRAYSRLTRADPGTKPRRGVKRSVKNTPVQGARPSMPGIMLRKKQKRNLLHMAKAPWHRANQEKNAAAVPYIQPRDGFKY